MVIESTEKKPIGEEPVNPREDWHEETDTSGQRWRVYNDGRRLKIGGTVGPGKPKKEVRQQFINESEASLKVLRSIRDNPNSLPAERQKAAEAILKYGLGTQDSVELVNPEQVARSLAEVLVSRGMNPEEAAEVTRQLSESLGIS